MMEKMLGSVGIVDCWQCEISEMCRIGLPTALWGLDHVALLTMGGKPSVFGLSDDHLVGAPR